MAGRLVVILKRSTDSNNSPRFDYLLRADVPLARQFAYANANYVSPFVPIAPDIDPDVAALRSGAVIEQSGSVAVDPTMTPGEIQLVLQRLQAAFQAKVTADKTYVRYGTYFDGTAWVPQGV